MAVSTASPRWDQEFVFPVLAPTPATSTNSGTGSGSGSGAGAAVADDFLRLTVLQYGHGLSRRPRAPKPPCQPSLEVGVSWG